MLHVELAFASHQLQNHVPDGTMTEISFACQQQSYPLHAAACAVILRHYAHCAVLCLVAQSLCFSL